MTKLSFFFLLLVFETMTSVPWQKFNLIRFSFNVHTNFKIHIKTITVWFTVTFNLVRKFTFIPYREN